MSSAKSNKSKLKWKYKIQKKQTEMEVHNQYKQNNDEEKTLNIFLHKKILHLNKINL